MGKGRSRELRGCCNNSGDSSWWLGPGKWLYLGCILAIAPTGFTDGLGLRCNKKKTVMTSVG